MNSRRDGQRRGGVTAAALRDVDWPIVLLLGVALLLGGGGSAYGLSNLVVQLLALGLLLACSARFGAFLTALPRTALALLLVTLLLPLIQLVPWPPGIWSALPGREMAVDARNLVGAGGEWFPLSLDRARTVTAALALLGPLAVMGIVRWEVGGATRFAMIAVVAMGLVNFAFGVLQYLAPRDALNLYPVVTEGRFYGLFANHNTSGLMFVLALCALLGLERRGGKLDASWALRLAIGAILVLGTLLTNSRSSSALLLLPLAVAAWRSRGALRGVERRWRLPLVGALVAILALLGGVLWSNERLANTWGRYANLEDSRPDIWADTLNGIGRYWPVGSGMGTFDEVFQIEESLETLIALKAGRAHNDYLELLLEAGIFGALVLLGWFVMLGGAWWRHRNGPTKSAVNASALALLCIALQSIVDYPLRNQALLCVAGLFAGLLLATRFTNRDRVID